MAAVTAVTGEKGVGRRGAVVVVVTWSKSVMTLALVMMLAVTHFPSCAGQMTCNEYNKCLSAEEQLNLTDSIREGHKQHVCVIASSAVRCLEDVRRDCDESRPHPHIVQGLESKRHNLTAYVATYCGSNGGDVTAVSVTVTVVWSVLLTVYLRGQ